jgi:hypothetical protein
MPLSTTTSSASLSSTIKMEDRKRPAISSADDIGPPSKRQAVNGGSKSSKDDGDTKDEAWIEVSLDISPTPASSRGFIIQAHPMASAHRKGVSMFPCCCRRRRLRKACSLVSVMTSSLAVINPATCSAVFACKLYTTSRPASF